MLRCFDGVVIDHHRTGDGSAAEELADLGGVGLGDLGRAANPAGDLGGLLLQVVAQPGLLAPDLARSGDPEALARARVRLVLRHGFLSPLPWCGSFFWRYD